MGSGSSRPGILLYTPLHDLSHIQGVVVHGDTQAALPATLKVADLNDKGEHSDHQTTGFNSTSKMHNPSKQLHLCLILPHVHYLDPCILPIELGRIY